MTQYRIVKSNFGDSYVVQEKIKGGWLHEAEFRMRKDAQKFIKLKKSL